MLADRVGIIDHGRIVAEGTPGGAEGGDRAAERRGDPGSTRPTEPRIAAVLGRFGEPCAGGTGDVAVRLARAAPGLRRRRAGARRGRPRGRRPRSSTRPPSTTSSSPRPGARSRAPRPRRSVAEAGAVSALSTLATQVGAARRSARSCARSASPRSVVPPLVFPLLLLRSTRGGLERVDEAARLPHRLLPRLRARGSVHAGRAVLDDERGHRPRPRHPDGLPRPARADPDARRRCSPASSPGSWCWGSCRRSSTSASASLPASGFAAGRGRRRRAARLRRARRARLRRARRVPRAAHRLRRGDPGALPGLLRLPVPLLDERAARA